MGPHNVTLVWAPVVWPSQATLQVPTQRVHVVWAPVVWPSQGHTTGAHTTLHVVTPVVWPSHHRANYNVTLVVTVVGLPTTPWAQANYRCNKCNTCSWWEGQPGVTGGVGPGTWWEGQLPVVGLLPQWAHTTLHLWAPVVWPGKATLLVPNNVTLVTPVVVAFYMCNKCNVVWAQGVVGRPTTGATS